MVILGSLLLLFIYIFIGETEFLGEFYLFEYSFDMYYLFSIKFTISLILKYAYYEYAG